ncbi:MAG: acyloxyacyl hydrolase [Muribaculaceae bacterium]|nr:acyloxyacyl hydrolase [Muribaculaceae bacterium]
MKNFVLFLIPLFVVVLAGPTNAVAANPFMGDNQNQVAFNLGQGVDSGFLVPPPFRLVPFYFMHFQYSQPTTFFRIPARQSFNIGQTVGFGTKYRWRWDRYSIPMVFLSEDIAVLHGRQWYFSVGAGGGLQAKQNERIGSKWLFQFKLAGGYRFTDNFGGELFVQHFSNGNTADENYSYAFYGMGLTYSF